MTKHFAQNLVDLSSRSLSPNRTAELSLYHREGGFDIRPLMVMLQEDIPVEVVEVPHPLPETIKTVITLTALRIVFEGYIRRSVYCHYSVKVLFAGVCLISRHFTDGKHFSCRLYQWGKLRSVSRFGWGCLNTGNDMSLDTADKMRLNPSLPTAFLSPLVVEPSGINTGGEAGGVNGEVCLDHLQWAGTLLDDGFEQWRQFGFLKVTGIAGERREFANQFLCFRFTDVGHETSAGHSGIDLIDRTKYHIGQWKPRSAERLLRLRDTVAEVSEQCQKPFLFVHLSIIISRPFLSAGHFDRLGVDGTSVWSGFPLDNELYSVDMLAGQVASLIIGAGAKRLAVVEVYDIASVAGLGGDFPAQPVFLNLACVGYNQPSLFSRIHLNTPYYNSLFYIYNSTHCMALSIVFMSILPDFIKLPIDKSICCMLLYLIMNEIQAKIAQLQEKGWTLAAIADKLEVTSDTVENWRANRRNATNAKGMLVILDELLKQKRIPKQRRYAKGSRRNYVERADG